MLRQVSFQRRRLLLRLDDPVRRAEGFLYRRRRDVLHQIKFGQVFGQASGRRLHWQPTILRIEAVHDCYAGHEVENARGAFSSFSSSDPKNVSRFFGLFGKQGTGHTHGLLDVLVGQGFLGAFADFLFDHLLRFSLHTMCQPCFQALKSVTGGFQGISGPFKPAETSTNHVHPYPFAILIVFVGQNRVKLPPIMLTGNCAPYTECFGGGLFEMQRDDGIARSKLGQIAIGFGHIGFDNVHHFFAKRNVLNDVQRFKVHAAASFSLVHDFSQQIRHSIPHDDTTRHIQVHVQRPVGFSRDRAKRRVQVGETLTATHAQVQIGPGIHGPKHGLAIIIVLIVPSSTGFHVWDLISQEFLLQVGA